MAALNEANEYTNEFAPEPGKARYVIYDDGASVDEFTAGSDAEVPEIVANWRKTQSEQYGTLEAQRDPEVAGGKYGDTIECPVPSS